ncbi:hypothetical protein [Actinoplanes sp. NPDC049118]|uniref:hypothetical protein n=1 Tax=Actinoplanes sp. NPDC049118 TaxID=3155769 RepID=UPI0033F99292
MPTLDELRELATRVRDATAALDDLRRERDKLIREVRLTGEHSVPEIADAAGVSPATVKTVVRGLR